MQITRKDVLWSYGATFLKIAVSVLLLPFILKMLPSETVGVWSVFMTITAFTTMLYFGFGPTFSRNVPYIYSGVKALKTEGFEYIEGGLISIDYGLLKGVIKAMRWFYFRMSIVLFLILATFGTYYIKVLLNEYSGNRTEVYTAWALLLIISTYNLYTLYYDALLQGNGLIKRSKQIIIAGQTIYLILGITLILSGYGLVAIVASQAYSVLIIRWLSYKSFFTKETRQKLNEIMERSGRKVLIAIYPKAIKILSDFLDNNPGTGIVGGNLYDLNMVPAYSFRRFLPSVFWEVNELFSYLLEKIIFSSNRQFNHNDEPLDFAYATGADLMIPKKVLERTGLFDPTFFLYFEETNLAFRTHKAGYKIKSIPQAKIIHTEGSSFKSGYDRWFQYSRGKINYYIKNTKPVLFRLILILNWLTLYSRMITFSVFCNNTKLNRWKTIKEAYLNAMRHYKA